MRRNNNIPGSAFIEFNSVKTANYFISNYNNKRINGHLFHLNWAKHNYNKEKENTDNTNSFYTVSK